MQRQVDALEKNKDCFFCVHKTVEVSEDEQPTGITFPEVECAEGKILPDEFLMMGQNYQFQTSSYLFNGDMWREYEKNPPEFKTVCAVGDETYMLYFASLGPVYYIDAAMSCYRRGVPTSWSERQKKATESRMFADKQKIWPKRFNHLIGTQKENFMIYVFYGNRSRCIWV